MELNPTAAFAAGQSLRMRQEEANAQNEQRRAAAAENRAQAKALEQQAAEDAALMQVFASKSLEQITPSDIYGKVNPKRAGDIWKGIIDGRRQGFKDEQEVRSSMLTRLTAIKNLPEQARQGAWDAALQDYAKHGVIDPAKVGGYSPELLEQFEYELLSPEQREKRQHPTTVEVSPGGRLVDPRTGKVTYEAPPKPKEPAAVGSFEDYVVRKHGANPTPAQIAQARKEYQQADDRPYRDPVPIVVMTGDGPQLVNRKAGTASQITDQEGQALGLAPTSEQRNKVAATSRAQPVLDSIDELSEKINVNQGAYAKMAGGAAKLAAKANLDDDVSEYNAVVSGFTPMLARMVGHTGVLTEQDVQSVRAMLPQPGDSKNVRDRKIARIHKILGAQGGGGQDSSVKVERVYYDANGNPIKK